jgi:UDP-N-acetyl-D-galactosamine dehydrogenase
MDNVSIAVVGLGYVGLPLAVALSKNFPVVGFDIHKGRIEELKNGHDRTEEVSSARLRAATMHFTSMAQEIAKANLFIVTVPTPVDEMNQPDLTPLEKACGTLGPLLKQNDIVVFESTVYPGVTEDVCGPLLEKGSGLKGGKDFFLGYSPERINPGDTVHTVDKITKVVAGQTPAVTDLLAHVYGVMNNHQIFKARSIKTAEAAKVIENTQRDINIAFMNELARIFSKMDLSIYDVLEAAQTKWNFLPFQPGLVGGHCIGVDPYYLAHCAKKLGENPAIILAGREINEGMSHFLAQTIHGRLQQGRSGPQKVLMLGLTFKENVPDLRNTKVVDLIQQLRILGHTVQVHDTMADPTEAQKYYQENLLTSLDQLEPVDAVVLAVPHTSYKDLSPQALRALLTPSGCVIDLKKLWKADEFEGVLPYMSL